MKIYLSLAALFFAALANAAASEIAVIDDPNPAGYQLNEGERLIMVVPSVDATSRYVPPEQAFGGAPRVSAPAPRVAAAPMPAPRMRQPARPARRAATAVEPVNEVAVADARSEVANQTFRRTRNEKEEVTEADEEIPWWKGGLWRNRRDGEPEKEEAPAPRGEGSQNQPNRIGRFGFGRQPAAEEEAPRTRAAASRAREDDPVAARRRPPVEDDFDYRPSRDDYEDEGDMWDDRRDPLAGAGYDDPYQSDYDPYAAQRQDPYAQPYPQQGMAADPYAQPYGQQPYAQQGGFGTDPNAPLGAYVDTSVYGNVPAIDAATGQPLQQYGATAGGYADPYAQPYPAPAAPYAGGYEGGFVTGGMTQPSGDPFGALPAQPYTQPAYDAQSGPQFENAVRMVKENRFTEAKAILASETSRNPSNAAAWRWLADCHYNLLELDDAIRCYQRSLDLDHSDYYALRGQGFSYLHRGHEYWRRMQEEVAQNRKEAAASTFALAHDDYKKSLEMLGLCLRRAPNDGEAIYGEAMAAEGASRKLYSNAISYLKLGPDQRERAELFAENCLSVINKGIEQSRERSRQVPGDSGPRALLGGLYLRKATLYRQLDRNDLALIELRNARDAQRSILDEIDKNNAAAERAVREIESLWDQWGGNNS